ncbi:hypothetical protein ZIOFF_063630 [Zingiber officinale]|uniref:Uncharacterized protein n=1 Tax=Zingiber officinale TaxID=94328 RepID=A0A8J5F6M1_ZINOF|nr:hypothetical protein ZIOFF_063630 [Zingiber officinale]
MWEHNLDEKGKGKPPVKLPSSPLEDGLLQPVGIRIIVNNDNVGSDVGQFTWLVNSADVMLGVHDFGLTNLLFLLPNATLILMVSWGGLEWMPMLDFGQSTEDMKLNYVQYIIAIEGRSLIMQYPRDHPMFKDPMSFHRHLVMRSTFIDNQNIKVNKVSEFIIIIKLYDATMREYEKFLRDMKMDKINCHDVMLVSGSMRSPKVQQLLVDFIDLVSDDLLLGLSFETVLNSRMSYSNTG